MTRNIYTIELPGDRLAVVLIEHLRGFDNIWAAGHIEDGDGELIDSVARQRYLSFDCDTEIVATVIAEKLDRDLSPEIWMILEDVMPECRCDLDDEGENTHAA